MHYMFSTMEEAVVWLFVNGWRQNDDGAWIKGKKEATVRKSPLNDGVTCVSIAVCQ